MVYDDDPYWFHKETDLNVKKKNTKYDNHKHPSIPDSEEVMDKIKRKPRADNPSPLLMEYMEKQNKNCSEIE